MLPCRAYALGLKSNILSYNVWYQELGAASEERQKRWREFLMDADEREREVQAGDWVEGNESQRRRMQQEGARPPRRRGSLRKPPAGQEGYFPQFYESF